MYRQRSSQAGGVPDLTDRLHLALTKKVGTPSLHYDLTDMVFKQPAGDDPAEAVKTSGAVTVDTVPGKFGTLTVYRLEGAKPDYASVLVKFANRLHVAEAAIENTQPDGDEKLPQIATATSERIEITDSVMSIVNYKVHLRVGQELVARLAGPAPEGRGS